MNIRMYHDLDLQLEEAIWELGEEAAGIISLDSKMAEEKAQKAWDLIPQILNFNGQTQRSTELLNEEIVDLEIAKSKVLDEEDLLFQFSALNVNARLLSEIKGDQ
ncbi:hypothetical protein [Paenibacillus sp. 8b26]|uniref:hypothetical protein n=1 Tax=Paenibacillus sp. 8b26 TaxID=3424133 RepID=UPI003D6481A9